MTLLLYDQSQINFWTIVVSSLIIISLLLWMATGRKKFWKSESAEFVHTRAIMKTGLNAPTPAIVINKDNVIIFVNPRAERVFGFKEEEVLEKPIQSLIAPRCLPEIETYKTTHAGGDDETLIEIVGVRKNKKEIDMEMSGIKWFAEDGRHFFYTLYVRDISHRKGTEATKKILSDHMAMVLDLFSKAEEVSDTGGWRWNLLEKDEKKQITVTPGFKKIFDVPSDQNAVEYFMKRVQAEDHVIVNSALARAMNGEGYEIVYRVVRLDLSVAVVECKAEGYVGTVPVELGQTPTDLYGTIRVLKYTTYAGVDIN